MIDALIEENKAMLEYAKASDVEFIDVLRKNIAALELQKSGVWVSREDAEATLILYRAMHVYAGNNKYTKESINHYARMIDKFSAALSAKESEL